MRFGDDVLAPPARLATGGRVGSHPLCAVESAGFMPLSAGTRLGAYEILSALGAGGMGEVYRVRDTRLDRDVAIKILPEAFAADGDRIARFQREAKTLASLNHESDSRASA